jgi:hypothetical protein
MLHLLMHLEALHLSMTTIASGTGLMLGAFAGHLLPTQPADEHPH